MRISSLNKMFILQTVKTPEIMIGIVSIIKFHSITISTIMIILLLMFYGILEQAQLSKLFMKSKTLSPVLIMSRRVSPYFVVENH